MYHKIKQPSSQEIRDFQKKILSWYKKNKRDLPWRNTTDPYYILVSEFMLQQTQVSRVIDYYTRFLNKFPTVNHLARANRKTLLAFWSGLGYNNRAIRLQETAKIICKSYGGQVPGTYEELIAMPGIGDYIASAVLSFAYNISVPVVDINIRRVLMHEFSLSDKIALRELKELAGKLIPRAKSTQWHNALMDYGASLHIDVKKKIPPITKQSKFKGSDRELRGEILRRLLKNGKVEISDLEMEFSGDRITRVVDSLIKDKLVKKNAGFVKI
jgi:A/G-specific adenine glycosylase